MWASFSTQQDDEKKILHWRDFCVDSDAWDELSNIPNIAAYLRRMLERYEESEFIKYLVLPSPVALSGFFHCTEDDIHQALQELQRQGYELELAGSTEPIMFWDPLIRRNSRPRQTMNSWELFYQAFFPTSPHHT